MDDGQVPTKGCWVRDADDREGMVVEHRTEPGGFLVKLQLGQEDFRWRRASELRSAFEQGFHVEHVPSGGTRASLGVGAVQAVRRLAGCEQVLVQLFESGRSLWLPFQVLRRVKPVETRIKAGDVGRNNDHAERFRLRVLAHALESWDQSTGALGRLDIDPLPHQIHVAHRVVSSGSVNWLIADDAGLGKTIEVGLILHALASRNQCRRVLIVCPSGLVRQWQDELRYKFDQMFEIYGRDFFVHDAMQWRMRERTIVSIDVAKRSRHFELLRQAGSWDLIVFDEAHRLGISETGQRTERFRLAEALRPLSPSLLLLSATPHQGKSRRFAGLLELVRPDLRQDIRTLEENPDIVAEIVIRNRKKSVTDASGNPIFSGHDTHRVEVEPSPSTRSFMDKLQHYLRHGYAIGERAGRQGRVIGFVMTTYRKLASSSIAAIDRALRRRLEKLVNEAFREAHDQSIEDLIVEGAFEDNDDLAEQVGTFDHRPFFNDEVAHLRGLLDLVLPARRDDRKLARFLKEVASPLLGRGDSLLVFTEFRATQEYLAQALGEVVPDGGVPGLIHGSMSLDEKIEAVRGFNEGRTRVLVSTEAGGEGLNLHWSCHVMVNYDLPWNPSRLVQRIGRLYRYGQTRRVIVFNLTTEDSFDSKAIKLMLDRVETMARDLAAVAGTHADVMQTEILGSLLEGIDLEQILERATSMRIELTEEEIDAAVKVAEEARRKQDEILEFSDSFDGTGRATGIDARHVKSFVLGMLPRIGVDKVRPSHGDRAVEVELPDELIDTFPEFGKRRYVTLAFDRDLARQRAGLFPVDFDSSFFEGLIQTAKARAFDGLFAARATSNEPTWLGVFFVRWQNSRGQALEDELVVVRCDKNATSTHLVTAELAELLLEPFVSVPAERPGPDFIWPAMRDAADASVAQAVTRHRQPASLFLLAAATFLPRLSGAKHLVDRG